MLFDAVGKVVRFGQRHTAVHLHVRRRVQFVRAVLVDEQVVHSLHAFERGNFFADRAPRVAVRVLAQQAGNGVFEDGNARKGDEHRHHGAHVPVQFRARIVRNNGGNQHGGRRHGIAQTVRRRRFKGLRVVFFGECAVEKEHEQFNRHRRAQHDAQQVRKIALFARKDALDRLHRQLRGDRQHHHGDDHRRHRFRPAVPEGVLLVGGLFAHLEPDQRHNVAAAVGEVVQTVRHHRNRARNRPAGDLRRGEQNVECNAQYAGKFPRLAAIGGGAGSVFFRRCRSSVHMLPVLPARPKFMPRRRFEIRIL